METVITFCAELDIHNDFHRRWLVVQLKFAGMAS